ncbi:carbon-monoxide dehydrogenase medium subunit [Paenibacillus endophyticus]|uniref:Carbon-monoxide dehydrogenase medium subunit n=1 Tax=Paenibacillus endophyticus TaxID=1294268 RepID=A0A7W5G9B0_9BACL|nr:FAD binding domain-containing protein [Paenibacillus endophyticus]MBB3151959.1 carbon-monoxide dehydrogenase medium subunit [Paenibacillus endophyticus]
MGMNAQGSMAFPQVWHPQTAAEAWHLKQSFGTDSVYVSGGTLLRTQWESGVAAIPKHLIDLSAIRGLGEIRIGETGLVIGGQVSLEACRTHPIIQRHFPIVTEALRQTAAPSIRRLGTIGGNIASNIGDSLPALLGYNAHVVWYNGMEDLQITLSEWLKIAGMLHTERLLLQIQLPFQADETLEGHEVEHLRSVISKTKRFSAYHKVGRREAFTPSVVTASVSGSLSEKKEVNEIRIALGGGQMIAQRLEELERELLGKVIDVQLLRHVYNRIMQLYKPREDLFASVSYRKTTAAHLIASELWKAAHQ